MAQLLHWQVAVSHVLRQNQRIGGFRLSSNVGLFGFGGVVGVFDEVVFGNKGFTFDTAS